MQTKTTEKVKAKYESPELNVVKFKLEQGFAASSGGGGRMTLGVFGSSGL